MLGVSRIYCSHTENSDEMRYKFTHPQSQRKPVVVFNCTHQCNLHCQHCYASSDAGRREDELSHAQAIELIDDIATFGCPAILFSGGEPLLRQDIIELVAHAKSKGLRSVLSTNGTLFTDDTAKKLSQAGADYIGISLDSPEMENNDTFRGMRGSYQMAMTGIENARQAGLKVGLRFTMTSQNIHEIPAIFDLMRRNEITRICFYHLVSVGRGQGIEDSCLSASETRQAMGMIFVITKKLHELGENIEVLTVDNSTDAAYLYMRIAKENPERCDEVWQMLTNNGGNASGQAIACVSWDGSVYPDQFWRTAGLGNVLEKPFSQIWADPNNKLLNDLRNRKALLCDHCRGCRFLDICNGNLRCRSISADNGIWGFDPACYLTDEEIAPQ